MNFLNVSDIEGSDRNIHEMNFLNVSDIEGSDKISTK